MAPSTNVHTTRCNSHGRKWRIPTIFKVATWSLQEDQTSEMTVVVLAGLQLRRLITWKGSSLARFWLHFHQRRTDSISENADATKEESFGSGRSRVLRTQTTNISRAISRSRPIRRRPTRRWSTESRPTWRWSIDPKTTDRPSINLTTSGTISIRRRFFKSCKAWSNRWCDFDRKIGRNRLRQRHETANNIFSSFPVCLSLTWKKKNFFTGKPR